MEKIGFFVLAIVSTLKMDIKSTNIVMGIGSTVVILLMVALMVLALNQIKNVKESITRIVDVYNKKIEYASNMREAIRLRKLMINKMLVTSDVFDRDEDLMRFYELAGQYRVARESLISMKMNGPEQELHRQLTALTRISQGETRKLLDAIVIGVVYEDIKNDLMVALSSQAEVLNLLNQLVDLQQQYSNIAEQKARTDYTATVTQVIILGAFIIMLSILVVVAVICYVAKQNEKLLQATNAKSDFLASMSHEIRTPLSAVIGFGESLTDPDDDEQYRLHAASSIVKAGKHLLGLINDILDISKVEANRMKVEKISVNLFQLLEEVEALMAAQAIKKNLLFCINYHYPVPATFHTDPLRLKQIILNLCSNAIKFTHQGGVTIDVKFMTSRNLLQFAITDTGIGLTNRQINKLFQPFSQADTSTTRQYGGTGLGLYLSKQLAVCLGGDITVTSTPEVGSCFTITADTDAVDPATLVNTQESEQLQPTSLITDDMPGLGGTILVAEDSQELQQLLVKFIGKLGTQVTVVDNGREAVRNALAQEYDLILMDYHMPIMNGIEAVKEIRANGYIGPILAMSASVMAEEKEKFLQAGCDDFVEKPIIRLEFVKRLSHYLLCPIDTLSLANDTPVPRLKVVSSR